MKLVCLALVLAAVPLHAQQPPVGIVDVYGARTLTAQRLREAAAIEVGDSVTEQMRTRALARLRALPNVRGADVAIVCCENGRSIAYIGVDEAVGPALSFGAAPTGTARLPGNIIQAGQEFDRALQEGVLQDQTEEDDSEGHSFMRYAPARAAQEKFAAYALGNVAVLRDVLQNSSDAGQRALAAQVIAYAVNKRAVVPDLIAALNDPDEIVRNNATRALAVMASWSARHPEAALTIPHSPFIQMLNSPVWTDRNKAAFVLMSLTSSRNSLMFRDLRTQAIPALADMVRWQAFGHAFPAALILGRMAGIPEGEIMQAFQKDREALIEAARLAL
jgi:hypothetical protein